MTQIIFDYDRAKSLGAISREEDLEGKGFISINPPPQDGRCEVCGRHLSELTPFGGPGDPLVGDFSGELLVKRWRPEGPYHEAAEEAWKLYKKENPNQDDDPLPWFISKFGDNEGTELYGAGFLYSSSRSSWECRDCSVLDNNEYFEKKYGGDRNK